MLPDDDIAIAEYVYANRKAIAQDTQRSLADKCWMALTLIITAIVGAWLFWLPLALAYSYFVEVTK